MNIKLAEFQLSAIARLRQSMFEAEKEIILKSCTGSGKTIILVNFMDEYLKESTKNTFIWLTPGKGSLEEQSKVKMDKYIHNSSTKLLRDVMISGFEGNDVCFINWEKLIKKGNSAFKESERNNFVDLVKIAQLKGIKFNIIIDESHQNNTVKADDIIRLFDPVKIIRCSATPKNYANAKLIEIPEEDVIVAGLIKRRLLINENFVKDISVEGQVEYLLQKAIDKQIDVRSEFEKRNENVNPLIIIQLPNKSDVLLDRVERCLHKYNINYENQKLAIWLSDRKQNLEDIEENAAYPVAVIIKQAVATGWDCPRAYILVKLRDNMDETFEIQTIGRIRRMPKGKVYEDEILDSCYLYTFDEKFTEGIKQHFGKGALSAMTLYLKHDYRKVELVSEKRSSISFPRDATLALRTIRNFFEQVYKVDKRTADNKLKFETNGYVFSSDIVKHTITGEIHKFNKEEFGNLEKVEVIEKLNTHIHGRDYHHQVSELGIKVGLQYNQMNIIIRRLFDSSVDYYNKILRLQTKEVYSFILNNFDRLKNDLIQAVSMRFEFSQKTISDDRSIENKFSFPLELMFTYDDKAKLQLEYSKNVYEGYLSSAEIRSTSEKMFEKYCQQCKNVDWFYKNGDKGNEYLSIVYNDNFEKQKLFYPDYVVSIKNEIWIIETKGGFDRSGNSEDIDVFSPKKFEVLKRYLEKHQLKGGFVRQDKRSMELCICMESYNNDINSESWKILENIIG